MMTMTQHFRRHCLVVITSLSTSSTVCWALSPFSSSPSSPPKDSKNSSSSNIRRTMIANIHQGLSSSSFKNQKSPSSTSLFKTTNNNNNKPPKPPPPPKSCDTFIAFGTEKVIFGKNSDRLNGEGQSIRRYPATKWFHDADDDDNNNHDENDVAAKDNNNCEVKCTYISIPQVSQTYAVLLSQIDWMWGAEHGTNEYGVVIGNEAVWTKVNDENLATKRLLGMDLLRLGLERSRSANEALEVITTLLETHGQGGPCAENDPSFTYHNSFLIGDSTEAWILETAGRQWVAKQYKDGCRNISNTLTIRTDYDKHSKSLYDYAKQYKLWKPTTTTSDDDNNNNDGTTTTKLDWAKCFGEGAVEECTSKYSRQCCGKALLEKYYNVGEGITAKDMMTILRDHDSGICMHGGFETTASMVSELYRDDGSNGNNNNKHHIHWMMDTPNPCQNEYTIQSVIVK